MTILNVTSRCPAGNFGSSFERSFHIALVNTKNEITTSLESFLSPSPLVDLIILHWPEWIQENLSLSISGFVEILTNWKEEGTNLAIVMHNKRPHVVNQCNENLYNCIKGKFDFALHFEKHSIQSCRDWAAGHYLVPHPLMSLPGKSPITRPPGIMILGHVRHKSEYKFIRKFTFVARLVGLKTFFGRFHDFQDQSYLINRTKHFLVWRLVLKSKTIRGMVPDEVVCQWRNKASYMLMFREDSHLNSAIPYTAISNHLQPIGLAHENAKCCMERMELPYLNGTSVIDIFRYLLKLKRREHPINFERVKREHDEENMSEKLRNFLQEIQNRRINEL